MSKIKIFCFSLIFLSFTTIILSSPQLYDKYQESKIKIGDRYSWCYQLDNPFDKGYCQNVQILDIENDYLKYKIINNEKYEYKNGEIGSMELDTFLWLYKKTTN